MSRIAGHFLRNSKMVPPRSRGGFLNKRPAHLFSNFATAEKTNLHVITVKLSHNSQEPDKALKDGDCWEKQRDKEKSQSQMLTHFL
jgi:hypothetical protein